jgi:3-oxoacyl-[acyl-carrier protein] reductase
MNSATTPRTAVVTGGAGYLGLGIARQLLRQGRRVVLVDLREAALNEAASELANEDVLPLVVDLREKNSADLIASAVRHHGWAPPTILVNNAGVSPRRDGETSDVTKVSLEDWDLSFWINVTIPMLLSQKFVPDMVSQGWGRIVNISSRAGRYNPNQAGPAYAASKAAMLGLTRSIANDFPRSGITCNTIAPGIFRSLLTQQISTEVFDSIVAKTPMGRSGSADELGAAVAFFTSDDASFVTGACLDVNGGHTMS